MSPAWFVSSVIMHKRLRSRGNTQVQSPGPAVDSSVLASHPNTAGGEGPPGGIHVAYVYNFKVTTDTSINTTQSLSPC